MSPNDEIDIEDVEDALKRADELAELTGRKKTDIVADLLDDGQLNYSAGTDTEAKKDILDVAQEKAEKLKTLLTTLIPVFALVMGIGAEGLGFVDLTGWGEDSMWEDEDYDSTVHWGCMDVNALNYDPMATQDDGSCYWEDNNGGGGGPPVNCVWNWNDNSYMDNENFLVVRASFSDNSCPHEMEGRFTVELIKDGEYYDGDEWENIRFKHTYNIEHSFPDLEAGVYRNHFTFETYDGSNWNWDSPETHEVFDDTCYPQTELDEPMLTTEENNLVVDLVFSDMGGCGQDIEIEMEVWNAGEIHDTLDYGEVHSGVFWIEPEGDTSMRVQGKAELSNLPDGDDWVVKVRYSHSNADDAPYESGWRESNSVIIDEIDDNIYGCTDSEATNYDSMATSDDGSCEYPPEEPCDAEIHNHYRGHVAEDEEQDAILVAFRVIPSNCEGEDVEIDIELFQNGYEANYSHWVEISGDDEYTDVSHVFDGVAIGNSWIPKITASLNDEVLQQVNFWGIDVVEQEPETCEINLYAIQIQTNNTTATVGFDLDCGEETNDLEGYNVTVQFLVYHVNETNSGPNATGPLQWVTQTYYIQGYEDDPRYLVLDNFSVNNTTHYDFYWYAMWEVDGEQEYMEQTWLNREVEP
tara:strand:- start:8112 stop:10022 length:1911 start_codon:yes stop_codon:yes gene_type:complete